MATTITKKGEQTVIDFMNDDGTYDTWVYDKNMRVLEVIFNRRLKRS